MVVDIFMDISSKDFFIHSLLIKYMWKRQKKHETLWKYRVERVQKEKHVTFLGL